MAVGKVPFAEQLATRCKPYFDALLNSGVEKFDEYIKTINDKSIGNTKELSDTLSTIKNDLGIIDRKLDDSKSSGAKGNDKFSLDDVLKDIQSATAKTETPPAPGQVSVLNLVARLSREFHEFTSKEEADSKTITEVNEKQEEVAKEEKKEKKKEKERAESKIRRMDKKIDKIDKKVHETKLGKILKTIIKLVAGGWVITQLWNPYIKPWLIDIAERWGFTDLGRSIVEKFKEAFPETYAKLEELWNALDAKIVQPWREMREGYKEKKREEERELQRFNTAMGDAFDEAFGVAHPKPTGTTSHANLSGLTPIAIPDFVKNAGDDYDFENAFAEWQNSKLVIDSWLSGNGAGANIKSYSVTEIPDLLTRGQIEEATEYSDLIATDPRFQNNKLGEGDLKVYRTTGGAEDAIVVTNDMKTFIYNYKSPVQFVR